ncbi:peptidoglycan-binding domain-containing protein [Kamptonema cortianum]|nr:peptidoglycan-binding domain-containing protein [Kamptonema cortianum]
MNQKIVLISTLIFAGVIGALSPCIQAQEPAPSTTIQPVFEEFKPSPENPPATAPPKSASPTAPPQKPPPKAQPAPAATPPKPTSQPAPPPAQAQFAPANARPPAPPTLAELPPLKTPGQEKFMETLGYQILLDRLFFSPGCIDGVMGPQTREAIVAFQFDRNLPLTGQLDAQTRQALGPLTNLITSHTVTPEETARLRPVPALWRERAAEPALEYETLLELIAEKYHASQNGIRRLNPNIDWPNPPAGTVVSVPNVTLGKLPKPGWCKLRCPAARCASLTGPAA